MSPLATPPQRPSDPVLDAPEDLAQRERHLRNRLADTLRALDQRWQHVHQALDVRRQFDLHRTAILLVGGGALLAVGVGVGVALQRSSERKRYKYHQRWLALRRMWEHPERIA